MKNSQIGRGIVRSSKTIKNDLKINELNQNMVYIKLDWILLLLIIPYLPTYCCQL